MTQTAEQIETPAGALCLDCNYPLVGLPTPRCPECGRDFDPAVPATMNLGRPMPPLVRWLLEPMHRRTWNLFFLGIGLSLWGGAWLPGGGTVLSCGLLLLVLMIAYRGFRLFAAGVLAKRYRQPYRGWDASAYHPNLTIFAFLFTCAGLIAEVPLHLAILFARPANYHIWAVEPANDFGPNSPPRRVGSFFGATVSVSGNSVMLDVPNGGTIQVNPATGKTRTRWHSTFLF